MWRAHLQQQYLRHVVLEQPIEGALVVGVALPCDRVELDLVHAVGHHGKLVPSVEDGAPIHLAVLAHELTGLALVHASVVVLGEFGFEKILIVVGLHLLQAHHVRAVVDQLAKDVAPTVVPRQRPCRTVRKRLGRRVDLGEHVVREERETEAARVRPRGPRLAHRDDHVVAHEQHPPRLRRRRRRDDIARLERLGDAALGAVVAERDASELKHVTDVVHGRRVAHRVRHLHPFLLSGGPARAIIDAKALCRCGQLL
mmetsp:Transcript_39690/g.79327  ORF Transcript_39690/g.79327 Transcript_39690/m.79327 type:complete len:256 (-) Transcript_39690:258-1025(-)